MRILWITNAPIGDACTALGFPASQSGSWIEAAAAKLIEDKNIILGIATTAQISHPISKEYGGIKYYCISGGKAHRGKRAPKVNKVKWKVVIDEFQPDLIRIWGTEFTDGLDVMEVSSSPVEIRLQGIIRAIDKYPNGYLTLGEMQKGQPWYIKLIMAVKYIKDTKSFKKQKVYESKMVENAACLVADNDWALNLFYNERIGKNNKLEKMLLKSVFGCSRWSSEEFEKQMLFCPAGRTGYKGLHQLIKAMAIVIKKYPDTKLYIPGDMGIKENSVSKRVPYSFYLTQLILRFGLADKIFFVGQLASNEITQYIYRTNIYVMPSCIENESSSLREAMMLGCPCIAADVGDVGELIHNGETGLLYRYEEYEELATQIIKLFDDEKLACRLANRGYKQIHDFYKK